MYFKVLHSEIKAIENVNLNRAFHYGDGFFESMYFTGEHIPLFKFHYERIQKSFECLKFDMNMLPSSEALYDKIVSSIWHKIAHRIRVDFTRESEGLYLPERNDVVFSIYHSALPYTFGNAHIGAYKVGLYTENKKAPTLLSMLKSKNSLLFVMAAIWAKEHHYNDVLLLNTNNSVCEGISSNVFINKDGKWYTPAIEEGCIAGAMRSFIIQLLRKKNIELHECKIDQEMLDTMDEMFMCSATRGIISCTHYLDKPMSIIETTKIQNLLSEFI